MKEIRVFAPNTIANLGCGYDVMGLALEHYGDLLTLRARNDRELVIHEIKGASLPLEPDKNVATVALKAMLSQLGIDQGLELTIEKNISPGSGLGSSASSAAAAVYALNLLLDQPYSTHELIPFAMEGERSSSGHAHADNVAPALLGGVTVVRSYQPLDVFNIPFPESLRVAIIFPQVETKTADAKRILKRQILLSDGVRQWGNVAGLVSGLILSDFGRIGASLEDVIIEPVRKVLIPFYDEVKACAMDHGALGFGISGSGPSTFALVRDPDKAEEISEACAAIYQNQDIPVMHFTSAINAHGAKIL
jgi:homoserine kinase